MTGSVRPNIEDFVEREIDEALRGLETVLPPDELAIIRSCIRQELLFHPDGQERVRRARPDPTVDHSGNVPKQPATTVEHQPGKKGNVK